MVKGVSSNFNSYALIHFILHLTNVPNPTRIVIIDQQKPETWCRLFETHQTLGQVLTVINCLSYNLLLYQISYITYKYFTYFV